MLSRLASICFRRRRYVLAGWLLLLVAAFTVGPSLAGHWLTTDRLPGTDSQAAYDLLARDFPTQNSQQDTVVFTHAAEHQQAINQWLASVKSIQHVDSVGPLQMAPGDDVAKAAISIHANGDGDSPAAKDLLRRAPPLRSDGVGVAFSGDAFESSSGPSGEAVGVIAALLLLVVALGSVVAAGLPIVIALVGIGLSVPVIKIVAHVVSMASLTTEVAAMIGIGVGIDYTLLVITRYRRALAEGATPMEATVEAIDRAGRAVALAGATVMISSLGMIVIGMHTFTGLAVGVAIAVAIAVVATVTLLPAILGFLGYRVNRWSLRRRKQAAPVRSVGSADRWARLVGRRPVLMVVAGAAVLLALAAPMLHLRLGTADAGTDPSGSTTRVAYDEVAHAFGPGSEGPILVVTEVQQARPGAVQELRADLSRQPGIVSVGPAQTSPDGRLVVMDAVPSTGPSDEATVHLLQHLRHDVLPVETARTGLTAHLGGETANNIDFAHLTDSRLPIFIATVLAISFLLLVVVLRSVVVPLKAVLLNLLSVGASYGILTAVFQWGWGAKLIGATPAPIAPWVPTMVFAIVFGLSMDYEIFLVSSIREAWESGAAPAAAVRRGLSSTARIITVAAAIMVFVFGSFVTSDSLELKVIGLGLAAAVLIDATIIRMVLAPALMTLFGWANWWFPGRSGRSGRSDGPGQPGRRLPAATAEPFQVPVGAVRR